MHIDVKLKVRTPFDKDSRRFPKGTMQSETAMTLLARSSASGDSRSDFPRFITEILYALMIRKAVLDEYHESSNVIMIISNVHLHPTKATFLKLCKSIGKLQVMNYNRHLKNDICKKREGEVF